MGPVAELHAEDRGGTDWPDNLPRERRAGKGGGVRTDGSLFIEIGASDEARIVRPAKRWDGSMGGVEIWQPMAGAWGPFLDLGRVMSWQAWQAMKEPQQGEKREIRLAEMRKAEK